MDKACVEKNAAFCAAATGVVARPCGASATSATLLSTSSAEGCSARGCPYSSPLAFSLVKQLAGVLPKVVVPLDAVAALVAEAGVAVGAHHLVAARGLVDGRLAGWAPPAGGLQWGGGTPMPGLGTPGGFKTATKWK